MPQERNIHSIREDLLDDSRHFICFVGITRSRIRLPRLKVRVELAGERPPRKGAPASGLVENYLESPTDSAKPSAPCMETQARVSVRVEESVGSVGGQTHGEIGEPTPREHPAAHRG